MPFKHNASRRHRIPKAHYRVQSWPAYEAGLKRRGDLAFWLDEAALAGWYAPRRSTPGGQSVYSDLAIELVLTLRLGFHLALRQAKAFAASVLRLLGQALGVPDHTTLVASVIADGAYDGEPVYAAAAARQREPPPDVVIPPRASAVPSMSDPAAHALNRMIRAAKSVSARIA